jgi:hypothetical protein
MLISILLSPLSAKIIQYDYAHKIDNGIICLDQSDTLYHVLTCKPQYDKTYASLTTRLTFAFPKTVGEVINPHTIGMKLHHIHKIQMFMEIIGDTRQIAQFEKIRQWLQLRDIQDNEYAFDAVLRTIKIFKKNTAKSCRFNDIFVPARGKILDEEITPLSIDLLNVCIANFINHNLPHFTTTSKTACKRRHKQLHVYAFRNFGKLSSKEYALRYLTPERTQRHAIRQFSKFLSETKNLTPFSPQS